MLISLEWNEIYIREKDFKLPMLSSLCLILIICRHLSARRFSHTFNPHPSIHVPGPGEDGMYSEWLAAQSGNLDGVNPPASLDINNVSKDLT